MIFSEAEIMSILKKSLPQKNYKDLKAVADTIISDAKHWQEADLNEHIHDDLERKVLYDICHRESNDNKQPKKMRLFFKK